MKDAIPGRTLSVACGDSCSPFCRLSATSSPGRGKSFHSGRALGKEGKFRPHRSTAGRSLPLSCKPFAPAKASPFRERWHGEAVTERVPHAKISTSVCKFYAQALIFPAGRATINSVSSCPKRGCGQGSADPAHCREGRRPATGVLQAARAP